MKKSNFIEQIKYKLKHRSLNIKVPMIYITSFIPLVLFICIIVFIQFERNTRESYEKYGMGITQLMADEIIPSHINDYLNGNNLSEYEHIKNKLEKVKNAYSDILYMYVYVIEKDENGVGWGKVIYDLDSDIEGDNLGDLYELDTPFQKILPQLLKGEEIQPIISDTQYGHLLTILRPCFDENGNCVCYVFCDFSMTRLLLTNITFTIQVLVFSCLIAIIILLLSIKYTKKGITNPLIRIYSCIKNFESDKLEQNIEQFKQLHISTGDEIELLYDTMLDSFIVSTFYKIAIKKAEEETSIFKDEAMHDSLTGYRNKRAFNNKLKELNRKMKSDNDYNFAIIMLDLNNLKEVNDTYGHEKGDIYLLGSTAELRKIFTNIALYRIGGDEFAVILKDEYYNNRTQYAIQISTIFTNTYNTGINPWEKYSIAFGIAERTVDDTCAEDILKRADEMMYEYKKQFKQLHKN